MTANPLQPIPSIGTPPSPGGSQGGQPSRFTPIDPLRVLRQYVWVLVIAAVVGFLAGVGYWWYLREFKSVYTTQARILVAMGAQDGYADPNQVMLRGGRDMGGFLRNQLPWLTSEEVLSDVLKLERVRKTKWFNSFEDTRQARAELARVIRASPQRGSALLQVSMSGSVPEDLPLILNEVVNLFVTEVRADIDLRTTDVRRTFVREVEQAQATLRQVEEQTRRFKAENDIHTAQLRNSEDTQVYGQLSRQLAALEISIQQEENRYNALIAQRNSPRLTPSPGEMFEIEQDPSIVEKNQRIKALREQRSMLLARGWGERHTQIQRIEDEVRTLEQRKAMEIEQLLRERKTIEVENAAAKVAALKHEHRGMLEKLSQVRTRMRDLESKLEELKQLEAGAKLAHERQVRAERLLEDMRVRSIRPDAMEVRVLTSAENARLTFPKFGSVVPGIAMMVLGAVAGLVFLKELLDQRVKSPQDVRLLPNTELLGVVPAAEEDPGHESEFERAVRNDPNGLLAESFRQLRTALLSRMDRRGYKTLMFVGTQGDSGVTAIISNMAASMAHNGRRVLVIDANFRRPSQHTAFGTQLKPGLFEVLKREASFEEAVAHVDGLSVDVLAAGDARLAPPEILEGAACRGLLGDLETQYDLILIDAPPALVASECQLLAKHVDAIAPVVRAHKEKRGMISRMLRQLDGYRADVLGIVLNGVRSAAGGYFRKSYQEFYDYRENGHDEEQTQEQEKNAA